MKQFMDFVQESFYEASKWNTDNSYSALTSTTQSLLFFQTPRGLRLNVSSLASPNFATSYSIGSVGPVSGSVSYLYSSLPLPRQSKSVDVDLRDVVAGYRLLTELRHIEKDGLNEAWHKKFISGLRDTLLYGRIFLPRSTLEALYMRRLSPTKLLKISAVSDSSINRGGTILAMLQEDKGKFSREFLYSTDGGLLGVRGLYNFGPDPREPQIDIPVDQQHGRFSAGAELYYGLLNKTGGMSTGLRFSTMPSHTGFPYTMTVTVNPLMGNLSSAYAVKAGRNLAFCSQFDFNFYSYESDLRLGCEIWQRGQQKVSDEVKWTQNLMRPGWRAQTFHPDPDVIGVFKARWQNDWKVGLLWETRLKEILVGVGTSLDMQRRDKMLSSIGVELQYSS